MCDASNYVVGALFGHRKDKIIHAIYHTSKTLTGAQLNYTTMENEPPTIMFAFDKFDHILWDTRYLSTKIMQP